MSTSYNTSIVTTGLTVHMDAANTKSYSGSGTNWNDVVSSSVYSSSAYTYPSFSSTGLNKYFTFLNNGTTRNNIYSASNNASTYSDNVYTRSAWFQMTASSGAWSPIIQNQIGNNTDMGLTINGNRLHFRQYTNTASSGTTNADYGVTGSLAVNANSWYHAVMVVNRLAQQVTFYLNGVLDSTLSIALIGNSSSNNIIIGGAYADSYSGDRMFRGNIAIVSHYNRGLTASEVVQNFNAHRGRFGV